MTAVYIGGCRGHRSFVFHPYVVWMMLIVRLKKANLPTPPPPPTSDCLAGAIRTNDASTAEEEEEEKEDEEEDEEEMKEEAGNARRTMDAYAPN